MATQYKRYTAKEGQRWDSIAQAAQGTPYSYDELIDLNPVYRSTLIFSGGESLLIPVGTTVATVDSALLPPWRR